MTSSRTKTQLGRAQAWLVENEPRARAQLVRLRAKLVRLDPLTSLDCDDNYNNENMGRNV